MFLKIIRCIFEVYTKDPEQLDADGQSGEKRYRAC